MTVGIVLPFFVYERFLRLISVCYSVPEWFQERLTRQSRGELRIRWSVRKEEWHIEQQVGRAAFAPYRLDPTDDSLIRARDGYLYVMAIRPGDRMPCPTCHRSIKIKSFVCEESTCSPCQAKGHDGRVRGCYFPLGEKLLEHLRKIDPQNGAHVRLRDEVDAANERMEKAKARAHSNTIEAQTKDAFTKIFEIPSVGYTGKVFTG